MEKEEVVYTKAKSWQIVLFPLSNGVNNIFMLLMMYANYIAVDGYGIAVTTAAWVITNSRVLDAFTDPIIGLFGDRFNSRFGKIRILMGIGFTVMVAAVLAMFFWGIGKGLLFYALSYVVYILGYTFYGIGSLTAFPVLTNDPVQRPKLSRWQMIYTMVFIMVASGIFMAVLVPRHGGTIGIPALQEFCLLVIAMATVFVIISMVAISDKDKPENFFHDKEKPDISFKDTWRLLKGNRALQMLIFAATSDKLALTAAGNSAIITMMAGIIIGNIGFGAMFGLLTMVGGIPFIILSTKMAGKKGNKKALVLFTWLSILGCIVITLFFVISDPSQISKAIIPTVMFIVIYAFGSGVRNGASVITTSMVADITDYEKSRSSKFMPAMVSTAYTLIDKVVSSFSAAIVGFAVAAIGYVDKMPQPGDPNTPQVFWMAIFLSQGLPMLAFIMTIIAMRFYPLSKEKMVEVQESNIRSTFGNLNLAESEV